MHHFNACITLALLVSLVACQKQGCLPYKYQPVLSVLDNFPPLWSPATILPNDDVARSLWNSISKYIPTNIPLKGTVDGDYGSDAKSYNSADPDCWWTVTQCVLPKLSTLPPDIADVPEPDSLGYGFDDGPNCSHDRFYDYLGVQQQKATMFFIGSNIISWPLQAQRAVSDGHEICLHSWSHSYMTALSSEDAFAELYYTMMAIKHVADITPTCWRPPYGDIDDRIRVIANQLGLRTILWNYDSNDWTDDADTVDRNYEGIIRHAEQGKFSERGAILLMHELDNFTMSKAIEFYPRLKSAFKYIVPVGVAINETHPYTEGEIPLPSFEQYNNLSVLSTSSVVPIPSTSHATSTQASTISSATGPNKTTSVYSTTSPSAIGASSTVSVSYSLTGRGSGMFSTLRWEFICLTTFMVTFVIFVM